MTPTDRARALAKEADAACKKESMPRRRMSQEVEDGVICTVREAWRNDGTEGESIHALCDALEDERERRERVESALGVEMAERGIAQEWARLWKRAARVY